MNVMICETFVGISFFISDFDFEKSGNEKIECFGKYFDFIFLEK